MKVRRVAVAALTLDGASNALAEEVVLVAVAVAVEVGSEYAARNIKSEMLKVIQGEHESSQQSRVTCIDGGWSQVSTFGERCCCCCDRGNTGGGMCCSDVD